MRRDPRAAAILPCPGPGRWALPRSGPPRLEGLRRAGGQAVPGPRPLGLLGRAGGLGLAGHEGGPPAAARVPPDGSRARAVGRPGAPGRGSRRSGPGSHCAGTEQVAKPG